MQSLSIVRSPAQEKRKPTLNELAELIRSSYHVSQVFGDQTRRVARAAIEAAVHCGGYLREAKVSLPHGRFLPWVKRETGIQRRTASNYMRLHKWVASHQREILAAPPHSLRQFYIMAGILPEDEDKELRESKDELAKLRRLVRKVTVEAAAHRDYADAKSLWRALSPLAELLWDVSTDTSLNGQYVSHSEAE